jgi:hypothetical protein
VSITDDTSTPTVESVWADVLDVQRKVRCLATLDLGFLSDEDVDALVVEVEEAARMVPVVQQALVAQVMDRGIDETHGCTSPMAYLQVLLRLRRSEANARVGAAERFQPRTAMTGEKLEPMFPAVAQALREGAISMDHASVIATSVEHLPAAVSDEEKVHAEHVLAERARESDPCLVGRYAQRIEAHLDPDGVLATEQEQREAQELFLRKDLHGMWRLSGRFDAENAATIQAALSLLAKPAEQPDGDRDPRPAALRRADALMTILRWSLDHDNQPTSGGHHPHIGVSITLAELENTYAGQIDHRRPDLGRDDRTDALRRGHLADRVQHRRRDPLPRPRPTRGNRTATQGIDRPRQGMHPPRVRRPTLVLRCPPHRPVERRRIHRRRQDDPALPETPHPHPQRPLAHRHDQRHPPHHRPTLARPHPDTTTQHRTRPALRRTPTNRDRS